MDLQKIVTIVGNVKVEGENGIYLFYFNPYRQYTFTDQEVRYRVVDEQILLALTGQIKTHVNHFKITSDDGLDFCWLSSDYAIIENKLRTEEEQDRDKWIENIAVDQPRDYKRLYKDLTGIDLNNKSIASNGNAVYQQYLETRYDKKGKSYGETGPKDNY